MPRALDIQPRIPPPPLPRRTTPLVWATQPDRDEEEDVERVTATRATPRQGHAAAEFKIQKGIPIPPAKVQIRYPFAEMEVGDSFLVPAKSVTRRLQQRMSRAAKKAGKRLGVNFQTRSVAGGVRVWRTED